MLRALDRAGVAVSDYTIPDVTTGNAGKRTTRPTSSADLHDPHVEHGGVCKDETGGAGCFLTAIQRERLKGKYQMRVMNAADAFYAALGSVELETALQDEGDVSLFTSIVIDALGLVAGHAVKIAAKMVRGSGAGTSFLGPVDPDAVARGDESGVGFALKSAIDAGKKGAKSAAKGGGEGARQKAAATSYLKLLGMNAAISFQHLREDPVGVLDDAGLIMATESMDAAMGHNEAMYAAKLREQLARFGASTASKVGRTARNAHGEQPMELAAKGDMQGAIRKVGDTGIRDTKLVLQTYADGSPSVLMYYMRDYDMPLVPESALDPEVDLSLVAEGGWTPSHVVDAEFAEDAIAANRAAWKRDYEVKEMSAPADGPAVYTNPKTRPTPPMKPPPRDLPDRDIPEPPTPQGWE